MSPRRIAKPMELHGVQLSENDRVFFMFGSANRDEQVFDQADQFDINRDVRKAISFGAGPHFCAGAWISRALVAEVALPKLFERFPNLRLNGAAEIVGWAFRGPVTVPVRWD
jgi:cytochrome P450